MNSVTQANSSFDGLFSDGVALAATQGLNQKVTEELKRRDAEMEQLKRTVAELKQSLSQRTQSQTDLTRMEHDQ
jgi:hypothetical protein